MHSYVLFAFNSIAFAGCQGWIDSQCQDCAISALLHTKSELWRALQVGAAAAAGSSAAGSPAKIDVRILFIDALGRYSSVALAEILHEVVDRVKSSVVRSW